VADAGQRRVSWGDSAPFDHPRGDRPSATVWATQRATDVPWAGRPRLHAGATAWRLNLPLQPDKSSKGRVATCRPPLAALRLAPVRCLYLILCTYSGTLHPFQVWIGSRGFLGAPPCPDNPSWMRYRVVSGARPRELGQYERVGKRSAPYSFIALPESYKGAYALTDKQLLTTHRDVTAKWGQPRSTAADPICWPNLYFSTGC
jgi:hypothetical protein